MDASAYRKIGVELANARLSEGEELRFVLVSDSMSPLLQAGDAVYIRSFKSYEIGDILSVRQGDFVLTHRLVRLDGEGLTLKGDRNRRLDPPIAKTAVLGKLAGLERADIRIAWEPNFWDHFTAWLSFVEGRVFEVFASSRHLPLSRKRRVLLQLATRPLRLIQSGITRRLALKYGAGNT